ncbi:pancreatic triacylglycerol lipase-like [Leguminivora glycinivorella]|uniref:pancreatic triacylglycerol lipase-like n=1 Tax=Leguminivora glycinivorella TaxID=1035111 RepID=UPI00200C34A6|nr:pancreatic triacylglycerol lipase-like [Leguminivora glycinivorella]
MRSRRERDIEYRLYTRELPDYIILDQSAVPSNSTDIRVLLSNKPVKLVTHGWKSSADNSVVMGIKEAYLKSKDVAVIGVDWSDTAQDYLYPLVAEYTDDVGARVGKFLEAFCRLYNVPGERLHLIGHSLGAHVMGIAASTTNVTIARITGLDPARPLFEFPKKPNSLTLDASDAEFVDVIHSCAGVLGVLNPIGHVDFFPNKGIPPQPGCESIFFLLEACSHARSHIYFAESIGNPTGFPACRSDNWMDYLSNTECKQIAYMGENVDRNTTGQYYLRTNLKEPYARNVA